MRETEKLSLNINEKKIIVKTFLCYLFNQAEDLSYK